MVPEETSGGAEPKDSQVITSPSMGLKDYQTSDAQGKYSDRVALVRRRMVHYFSVLLNIVSITMHLCKLRAGPSYNRLVSLRWSHA